MNSSTQDYRNLTTIEKLNFFRNKYYNDGNNTENGIIANAINDVISRSACRILPGESIWIIRFRIENNKYHPYLSHEIVSGVSLSDNKLVYTTANVFFTQDDFDRIAFVNRDDAEASLSSLTAAFTSPVAQFIKRTS